MASSADLDVARLILTERWAALATIQDGGPLASMVAYAAEPGLHGLLLFLSQLASHTRNLLDDPRASLVVTRPDNGTGDPQLLPRVGLVGQVKVIAPDEPGYEAARQAYVDRFPESEPRFALADFVLFRFVPADVRYVGGFARAFSLSPVELSEAAAAAALGPAGA